MDKKDKNRTRVLVPILVIITVAALALAAWAIFLRQPAAPPILPPDTLPEVDENVIFTDEPEDTEKMPQEEGGGSANITYSQEVTISLSDQAALIHFKNPARSNQSMVLELLIQDVVIFQSGGLPPGSQVESLPLLGTARLSPGGYDGIFRVSFYDATSGLSSAFNTVIPVTVTVVE